MAFLDPKTEKRIYTDDAIYTYDEKKTLVKADCWTDKKKKSLRFWLKPKNQENWTKD